VSEGYLKLEGTTKELMTDPKDWTGVFVTPTTEILLSGAVHREDGATVVMKLDPMIDEYKRTLDDYVTRVQLLDFVV
jgi:hypothetical protein